MTHPKPGAVICRYSRSSVSLLGIPSAFACSLLIREPPMIRGFCISWLFTLQRLETTLNLSQITPLFPPSAVRRLPRGLPNPLRSRADPKRQQPSPDSREVYDES